MAYVIGEPCIDSTDRSCVEECPVDCIYEGARKLYIHPAECIDCGACEVVCPVGAISVDRVADPIFKLDNRRFFDETLPGRSGPLGAPGGSALVGPLGIDTPMVASYDVPLSEGAVLWRRCESSISPTNWRSWVRGSWSGSAPMWSAPMPAWT